MTSPAAQPRHPRLDPNAASDPRREESHLRAHQFYSSHDSCRNSQKFPAFLVQTRKFQFSLSLSFFLSFFSFFLSFFSFFLSFFLFVVEYKPCQASIGLWLQNTWQEEPRGSMGVVEESVASGGSRMGCGVPMEPRKRLIIGSVQSSILGDQSL